MAVAMTDPITPYQNIQPVTQVGATPAIPSVQCCTHWPRKK